MNIFKSPPLPFTKGKWPTALEKLKHVYRTIIADQVSCDAEVTNINDRAQRVRDHAGPDSTSNVMIKRWQSTTSTLLRFDILTSCGYIVKGLAYVHAGSRSSPT